MLNSPVDCKGLIISQFLNMMYEAGWIQINVFPAYLPDDVIVAAVQTDPKNEFYVFENDGMLIETHEGSKSYFFNTHHKLRLNPFYNTKVQSETHHPSRRGFE